MQTLVSLFDVILILAVFWFVLYGLWFGLIHAIGSLVGIVFASIIAGQWYTIAPEGVSQLAAFIIIFLIINRLVGLAFYLVQRFYHLLTIIPLLKSINRIAGGVFGLVEGMLIIGTILIVAQQFPLGSWFTNGYSASHLVPYLVGFAGVILPFLPEALKQAQAIVPQP